MAEVSIEDRVYKHEAKPQPKANAPEKIVEAFGLGKCPKLAKQVRPNNASTPTMSADAEYLLKSSTPPQRIPLRFITGS